MGFPSGRWYRKNGKPYHELIIDDQVDVANPIIQAYILQMQKGFDAPPKPLPMKNDRRKLDWRPVWEWHKKHPEIGMNDLARLLGYERSYLSRKLNELEDLK